MHSTNHIKKEFQVLADEIVKNKKLYDQIFVAVQHKLIYIVYSRT